MKILLEAHHPAHIHFWKFPVQRWLEMGHEVLMIARDRDVMKRLLRAYDWIPATTPPRKNTQNRFPMIEMLGRQWVVSRAIARFRPDVVASLMGSYAQSSKLFLKRNIIFTDSEFQTFNHRIAHPFADEIHTPACLSVDFGAKHHRYPGFHELAYINDEYFDFDDERAPRALGLTPGDYVFMRLSAWNTLHDIGNRGLEEDELRSLVADIAQRHEILIQGEEGRMPRGLEKYQRSFPPEDYHGVLCHARLVVTEGFTTASETLAMGVPCIVVNALDADTVRYQHANYQLVQHLKSSQAAAEAVRRTLEALPPPAETRAAGAKYRADHGDVVNYVVQTVLGEAG